MDSKTYTMDVLAMSLAPTLANIKQDLFDIGYIHDGSPDYSIKHEIWYHQWFSLLEYLTKETGLPLDFGFDTGYSKNYFIYDSARWTREQIFQKLYDEFKPSDV